MSYTITQQATSPNAAYTRLLYAVSGSIYTTQPQFQYVMDVYESGSSNLIKRTTQTINPAGVAIFDPSRIIQGELLVDYNWKINSVTEFNSSSKEFIVEFGEQFATSISSSVTVYPTIASSSIETFQGVVEPNAGYYNWDSASYAVLSNMPATMSMQTDDFGTLSVYNNDVSYVSQSFYSASSTTGTYDLVDQKNYSITDNFSAVPISSSANYWNYVDVSVSSSLGIETYRYEASDETHREKTRFAFVNKLGAWDYYNNYNPVRQAIKVEREQYTAARVDYSSLTSTYDISRRGLNDYHNSTDDMFTVDTDLLDKTNANWLEELIESPEVYIQRNGEFIPIVITDSSYVANQNQARQKQFKYTINFKPSNQPFGTWIPEYVQCPKAPTNVAPSNPNLPIGLYTGSLLHFYNAWDTRNTNTTWIDSYGNGPTGSLNTAIRSTNATEGNMISASFYSDFFGSQTTPTRYEPSGIPVVFNRAWDVVTGSAVTGREYTLQIYYRLGGPGDWLWRKVPFFLGDVSGSTDKSIQPMVRNLDTGFTLFTPGIMLDDPPSYGPSNPPEEFFFTSSTFDKADGEWQSYALTMPNTAATASNSIADMNFQFTTGSFNTVPAVSSSLVNVPASGSSSGSVNYIGFGPAARYTGRWDSGDAYMYLAVYSSSLTEAQLQQNFQAFVTSSFA